jgi:predicted AAA+ superfamily ATPase
LEAEDAFVWQAEKEGFLPVKDVNLVPLFLLKGIDRMRDTLLANTLRFARGLPANNALLWGARGMGKSSLVKAVHGEVAGLKLVEIHREDLASLPRLLDHLRAAPRRRFILYCDDLSFEALDTSYKSLKAVLEGGIEGRPFNVLFYATSNRRHLMPREMEENERSTAINPGEAVEEKLSLSDRFGLWIGFHNCSQDDYLEMVRAYANHYGLGMAEAALREEALAWALARGSRSGRVAWQFIQDLAGRLGARL